MFREPTQPALPDLRCTLTGVDAMTPLPRLIVFSESHPYVEWGVLYSPARTGRDRDYPCLGLVRSVGTLAKTGRLNAAIHLCGDAVRRFVEGDSEVLSLAEGFQRIQLNFDLSQGTLNADRIEHAIARSAMPIITQFHPGNAEWTNRGPVAENHHLLVDASGGRGAAPERYTAPPKGFEGRTGYAGGLAPANLPYRLPRIISASKGSSPLWVDIGSSLRWDDWFCLAVCERVLRQIQQARKGVLTANPQEQRSADSSFGR